LGTFALLATGAENMLLLCYRKRSKTTLFFAAALQIILILFGILGSFNSAMILLGRLTIAALSLLIFVGCATTPIYDETRLTLEVVKRPFNEWPEVYKQLEKKGRITPEKCKEMTDAWVSTQKSQEDNRIAHEKEQKRLLAEQEKEQKRLASERKRMWDSLTPAQKMDFELRQQQLAQQQAMMAQQQANMVYQAEAQRRANVAGALSNFQQSLQNQEMINSYDRRTRVMSQPVNVNVNGNINHNFNGGYVQPYSRPWYSY
jgi:hypothetical protein